MRRTSSWCDMMGFCGSSPVADKLSELTSFAYDKRAVCRAMHELREHTTRSHSDWRSGFARRGITWVMPSAPGALFDAAEVGVCVPLPVSGQLTMSEHLRNTAVERCSHRQSDRAWRKVESVITMSRASDDTLRRVRVRNELLSSLQSSKIKLWRDDYYRSVFGLPPLDFLFGSALVSEQLHLHESAPCKVDPNKKSRGGSPSTDRQ